MPHVPEMGKPEGVPGWRPNYGDVPTIGRTQDYVPGTYPTEPVRKGDFVLLPADSPDLPVDMLGRGTTPSEVTFITDTLGTQVDFAVPKQEQGPVSGAEVSGERL